MNPLDILFLAFYRFLKKLPWFTEVFMRTHIAVSFLISLNFLVIVKYYNLKQTKEGETDLLFLFLIGLI